MALCVRFVKMNPVSFTSDISYIPANRGFRRAGRMLAGARPYLEKRFYPDFDRRLCLAKGAFARQRSTVPVARHRTSRAGLGHGKAVDIQIGKMVSLLVTHSLPTRFFASSAFRSTYRCSPALKAKCKRLLKDTQTFFLVMARLGLSPVATQVKVASPTTDVATACDVVARNVHGEFLVIEVKTGHWDYLNRSNSPFKTITPPLPNSTRNQHLLQLALTHHLFVLTHQRKCAAPLLVRLSDGKFQTETVPRSLMLSVASI